MRRSTIQDPETDGMTQYSHRTVWHIAGPMIISNVSIPLLGIVDTAVMGHLEAPYYLGAVGVGAMIFNVLFMGLNFLRMGTTGLCAQDLGAGDSSGVRALLMQALVVALAMASLLLLLQVPIENLALWLVSPSDPAVAFHTRSYFAVRIWAAPLVLINYVFIGWFIGLQNARAALIVMLAINLMNIILDLVFVVGLGMTVNGVALATVLAEMVGILVAVWLVSQQLITVGGAWDRTKLLDLERFRHLLSVNVNILIRTMALMLSFGILMTVSARMGPVILAANTLLLQFQHLMSYALDGFAHAAEALVGRAIGEKDRQGFERAVRLCLQWSLIVAIIACGLFFLLGDEIIALLTTLPDVRKTAGEYLIWMAISPFISVWSFLYDGVYIGATKAREMRNSMLFSAVVFIVSFLLLRDFGNHGLWAAFILFMAVRGGSMHWLFKYIDRRGGFVSSAVD